MFIGTKGQNLNISILGTQSNTNSYSIVTLIHWLVYIHIMLHLHKNPNVLYILNLLESGHYEI